MELTAEEQQHSALGIRPLESNVVLKIFLDESPPVTLFKNSPLASHHLHTSTLMIWPDSSLARSCNPTVPTQDSDKPNGFQFSAAAKLSLDYRT